MRPGYSSEGKNEVKKLLQSSVLPHISSSVFPSTFCVCLIILPIIFVSVSIYLCVCRAAVFLPYLPFIASNIFLQFVVCVLCVTAYFLQWLLAKKAVYCNQNVVEFEVKGQFLGKITFKDIKDVYYVENSASLPYLKTKTHL